MFLEEVVLNDRDWIGKIGENQWISIFAVCALRLCQDHDHVDSPTEFGFTR